MHHLLERIFESGSFLCSDGRKINVHSHTDREQCMFLQCLVQEGHYSETLEVGFAFGISTLALTEASAAMGGHHTVIDPFEHEHWEGVGLDLMKQSGLYRHMSFYESYSFEVLGEFIGHNKVFDLAYVDSTKLYDWLMTDFFLLDKLIRPGGMIVFDDVHFPSVRKLARFISHLPHYDAFDSWPKHTKPTLKQRLLKLTSQLPGSSLFLKNELKETDEQLGINARCVAFKKVSEDQRRWDWHTEF